MTEKITKRNFFGRKISFSLCFVEKFHIGNVFPVKEENLDFLLKISMKCFLFRNFCKLLFKAHPSFINNF